MTEKISDDGKFNVGDIIYTSWGYDQTQYDFAQIVEVSKTRKTVVAQRMRTKIVDPGRQADGIVPTEAYGNKFRLYVREWRDEPTFRGQYPFIDGFNDSKRMGSFWPWDGKTVYETNSQFGH